MRILPYLVLAGLTGVAPLPAMADPLGRLFTTPEQRRALDAVRDPDPAAAPVSGPRPEPAAPAGPGQVVLNGVVRRSHGPDVVWVNGSRADDTEGQIRLHSGPDRSNGVTLEDAADGTRARLKPGQYWEPATGRVADCHGCGTAPPSGNDPPLSPEDTASKP